MYEYRKHATYFAQCGRGLEEMLAAELLELGASRSKPVFRGAGFNAAPEALYRIVYGTRLASRILAPLRTFDCHSDKYLYETALKLDWSALLTLETTFAITAQVSQSNIKHSQFAAQKLKDAIVDQFRDRTGRRPSVERRHPDLHLNLNIHRNRVTISLDAGGGPLHRRGYRRESVEAPLQETLAAGIIRLSGWRGTGSLVDPFCGSGTLLAEALMAGANIPAGWLRMAQRTPLSALPDFDAALWRKVKSEADARIRELPAGCLRGGDIDPKAVSAARTNLALLPGGEDIRLARRDFRETGEVRDSTIVANPPYGVRLQDRERAKALFGQIGDFLKQDCAGSTAWLLCGEKALVKSIGLRAGARIPLWNGGLECRLIKLELYAGKGSN